MEIYTLRREFRSVTPQSDLKDNRFPSYMVVVGGLPSYFILQKAVPRLANRSASIPFVLVVLDSQALDRVTIQVAFVFPLRDSQIFEVAFFVICFPGVTQIAFSAGARCVGEISHIRVADWLSIRARKNGDVAHRAFAIESNDEVLIVLVVAKGPNLLAFVF